MRFNLAKAVSQASIRHQTKIMGALVISSLANLILGIGLLKKDEHWVLIPHYDLNHKLGVTRHTFSEAYLMDWSAGILNTLLCANPSNIDWKISQILKISILSYGDLKDHLRQEAEKMKKDKVSTAFYPNRFKVDQNTRTVEVTGEFSAQFGKDTIPVVSEKTYAVGWDVRSHGAIVLSSVKELKKEPKKEGKDHGKP